MSETLSDLGQIGFEFVFHDDDNSWMFPTVSIGKIQRARPAVMLDISNMSKTLKEVVSDRLQEIDKNPFEAARKSGLERSYINDILIDRKVSVREDKLPKLATSLDWTVHELLTALGRNLPPVPGAGSALQVHGRIGAGQEILPEFEQLPPDGLFEIQILFDLAEDAIAFEVAGESMWPRYDEGDVIVCWDRTVDPATALGWEAAVRTVDGRRFLKRIVSGSRPGLFTLESHNAKPIVDVRLAWVSPIEHVVRSGRWMKLSREQRKSQVRKALSR